MVTSIQDIKEISAYFVQGFDFNSSSIKAVCLGTSNNGVPVIGCSWKNDEFYWYEVTQAQLDDLSQIVKQGRSVGNFISVNIVKNITGAYELVALSEVVALFDRSHPNASPKNAMSPINPILDFSSAFARVVQAYHSPVSMA